MTKILIVVAAAAAILGLSACDPTKGEPVPQTANPGAPISCAIPVKPRPVGDYNGPWDPGFHPFPRHRHAEMPY